MAALFVSCSCTDEEQAKLLAQQQRIEELEQRAKQTEQAHQEPPQEAQPEQQAPQQEEQQQEPEMVDVYVLPGNVKCFCHEQADCGTGFWHCSNETIYECQHDVRYNVTSTTATEDNSRPCN
jgi:hypothetical protein